MQRRRALTLTAAGAAALALSGIALVASPVIATMTGAERSSPQSGQRVGTAPATAPATPPASPVDELRVERVTPQHGNYGTGITLRVHFDREVPVEARAAVTNHVTVETSKDIGPAGWAWIDGDTAVYRPKAFWPAGTQVHVSAYPTMAVIATEGPRDLQWVGEVDRSFAVGRSQEIRIDSDTREATVTRDGTAVRTMPVSLGKEGWLTRSGVKTLMESYEVKQMTGASIGAEEDYTLDVPYAIRITDSGEFVHAAPWAAANLGRVNGSHGCTNLSLRDAKWLYEHHLVGDPVITTGTGRTMEPTNGTGGVWNVSWSTWVTGSI